jgi:hypothetical protein
LKLSADEKEVILMKIISEDFIEKLPALSANWQQSQMPIRLSLRFVRKMDEERSKTAEGKKVLVKHWIRYYQLSGLDLGSPDRVLPLPPEKLTMEAFQQWHQRHQAEKHPALIVHRHLVEAMWPIIRSSRKPLELRLRRTIGKWVWGGLCSSEEDLWYSALVEVFLDWHLFVIGRYGDDTKRLLQDVKRRAHQLQDPEIRAEICRGVEDQNSWEKIQWKIRQRVSRLRYYGQSVRSSLYWWLSAQGIYVDAYDLLMLRDRIDRFDPSLPVHSDYDLNEYQNLWTDDERVF